MFKTLFFHIALTWSWLLAAASGAALMAEEPIRTQCPTNINVYVGKGVREAQIIYAAPQATSECPGGDIIRTLIQGPASGETFRTGVTQICYLIADTCGNELVCCFTITLIPTLDASSSETTFEARADLIDGQELDPFDGEPIAPRAKADHMLKIWPNPTGDLINISLPESTLGKKVQFNLVDLAGRLVFAESQTINDTFQTLGLRHQVNPGAYFLEVQVEGMQFQWTRISVMR